MCRSPCMDFLPPSGGVFRLSLVGSSPCIPCRRSFDFQGAVRDLAIKIATQQPEPDHPFRDSLGSGLLCSDKRAKNLLRLLWTSNGNTKCLCHIKLLEYTATEIELCQQKFLKHATFGCLQEKMRETLAKRERAGPCQPS